MWREQTPARALEARRELLEHTVAALENELASMDAPACGLRPSAGGAGPPPLDAEGPDAEARGRIRAQLDARRGDLWAVRIAEDKLRRGIWGRCADCGGPIEVWLLRAVPEAWLCAGCEAAAQRWR